MCKENRFGWPLRGIIWFTLAIVGSCAVIALLAGYDQTTRSLEKVSSAWEPSRSGWDEHADHGDHNPAGTEGLVKGYVDIVFDHCFMIEGIRIVQTPTGLFVSFPAKKQRDGTHGILLLPPTLRRE
jgi:hypothetical protein